MKAVRPMSFRAAEPAEPRFLRGFLFVLVAVFVAQKVLEVWFGSAAAVDYGALSWSRLRAGYFWTPLTHALLHGGVFHLLCNVAGIFFLGRHLQESVGPARLAALTVFGGLGAGLAWLGLNQGRPGYMIGASGVGMAYLAAFVALDPRRPFIFPLLRRAVPAWALLAGFCALDIAGLLLREAPRRDTLLGVAHSAHLGGVAAGWLACRLFLAPRSLLHALRPGIEPPRWARQAGRRPAPAYRVNLDPPAPASVLPAERARHATLRAEVDRLLDQVAERGFDALTPDERRFLADAGRNLNRR